MRRYLKRAGVAVVLLGTFSAGYAAGHPSPNVVDNRVCIARWVLSNSPQQA